MKNLILLLFFVPLFANAQTTHTVAPKETLYSLARKYNIPPKDLAAYNNIPVTTGLTIGQQIKIPGKAGTAAVKSAPPAPVKSASTITKADAVEAGSAPVYHKVEKKETLYHISKLYPNTTVDDIKKWNHLSGDGVSEGTNLIVGYQKGKKTEAVVSTPVKEKAVVAEKPIAKTEAITIPAKTMEPVKAEANNKITGKSFNGGYFKSLFAEQTANNKNIKEETGTAAVFKSSSGWEDGKYYCLHNTAPAGSIIKITNKSNNRSVYAKVLDVIPDLKQNAGIMIRLSNAAADELGAGENNFESVINY